VRTHATSVGGLGADQMPGRGTFMLPVSLLTFALPEEYVPKNK